MFALNAINTSRLLRWLATSLLIVLSVWQLKIGEIWQAGVSRAIIGAVLLAAPVFLIVIFLNGLRWTVVASSIGLRIGLADALKWTLIGHFFNQVLPSSVGGDVIRGWLVRQRTGDLRLGLTSVALERFVGLLALVALIIAGQPILIARLPDAAVSRFILPALLFGCGLALAALLLDRVLGPCHFRRVRDIVRRFCGDTRQLTGSPSAFLLALAISFAMNAVNLVLIAGIANGLGATVSVTDMLLVVPTVMLVASLPISIGGWGLREAGLAVGFTAIGQPASTAVATSIIIGVANLISAIPGAVAWAAFPGSRHGYAEARRLQQTARAAVGGMAVPIADSLRPSND